MIRTEGWGKGDRLCVQRLQRNSTKFSPEIVNVRFIRNNYVIYVLLNKWVLIRESSIKMFKIDLQILIQRGVLIFLGISLFILEWITFSNNDNSTWTHSIPFKDPLSETPYLNTYPTNESYTYLQMSIHNQSPCYEYSPFVQPYSLFNLTLQYSHIWSRLETPTTSRVLPY